MIGTVCEALETKGGLAHGVWVVTGRGGWVARARGEEERGRPSCFGVVCREGGGRGFVGRVRAKRVNDEGERGRRPKNGEQKKGVEGE